MHKEKLLHFDHGSCGKWGEKLVVGKGVVTPPPIHMWKLEPHSVTVIGDRAFREVIKVK